MTKLMLTCVKCGFVGWLDSREVALLSGWRFIATTDGEGPCCPACKLDGDCDPASVDVEQAG